MKMSVAGRENNEVIKKREKKYGRVTVRGRRRCRNLPAVIPLAGGGGRTDPCYGNSVALFLWKVSRWKVAVKVQTGYFPE